MESTQLQGVQKSIWIFWWSDLLSCFILRGWSNTRDTCQYLEATARLGERGRKTSFTTTSAYCLLDRGRRRCTHRREPLSWGASHGNVFPILFPRLTHWILWAGLLAYHPKFSFHTPSQVAYYSVVKTPQCAIHSAYHAFCVEAAHPPTAQRQYRGREWLTVAGTASDFHRLPLLPEVQTGALHQHYVLRHTRKTSQR